MQIVSQISELRRHLDGARCSGSTVGFVPTMGWFHEGHLQLMKTAVSECDVTVTSLFVNPTQFGPGEDLAAYPRDLDRDAQLAQSVGVDLLFAPSVDEMYPRAPMTEVAVPDLANSLCALSRPWHFGGVATVVAKLFGIVGPCRAYFGRKDAQQLAVVERLAVDLNFPVTVVGCPIVRHSDGVAMSSRNVYLSVDDRVAARSLNASLERVAQLIEGGERDPVALKVALTEAVTSSSGIQLDYAEVVDRTTLHPPTRAAEASGSDWLLAVAAKVGPARLIDNMTVMWSADGPVIDRGVRLDAAHDTTDPHRRGSGGRVAEDTTDGAQNRSTGFEEQG